MRFGVDARYIQDHFPGIGRYTYSLIRALSPLLGQDTLVLLVSASARNTRFDLAALARLPGVEVAPVTSGVFALSQQLELPRLARRLRLDLYHNPYYIIPYAMPCPVVATVHDLIPYLHPDALPQPRLRWLFTALVRLTVWRARVILVDSVSARDDLVRIMGASPGRVTATLLAADASFHPQPAASVAALRARLGLEKPYLLYLGINKPHKNLARLVEAWVSLPQDLRQRHQLVLAGRRDPRYDEEARLCARLALGEEVRWLDSPDNETLPLLYAGAKAFVFPSLYEGFGLPVLEAMASGVPVACSDASSLPEIVGDAALTFPPQDVAAMARALERLLTEPLLAQKLAARGLARAATFTWERTAREVMALYRRVARETR
jgi:glycosyltransferase involved in cell wall biosynthesis